MNLKFHPIFLLFTILILSTNVFSQDKSTKEISQNIGTCMGVIGAAASLGLKTEELNKFNPIHKYKEIVERNQQYLSKIGGTDCKPTDNTQSCLKKFTKDKNDLIVMTWFVSASNTVFNKAEGMKSNEIKEYVTYLLTNHDCGN